MAALTMVQCRQIGESMALSHRIAETVDAKTGIMNALYELAGTFPPVVESKIIGAFLSAIYHHNR